MNMGYKKNLMFFVSSSGNGVTIVALKSLEEKEQLVCHHNFLVSKDSLILLLSANVFGANS
jgi:hypothetical protein